MKKKLWDTDDLYYAFLQAISFLEQEETPIEGEEGKKTIAGYKEAAKRIRKMAKRLEGIE
jgi:hypothetical protein